MRGVIEDMFGEGLDQNLWLPPSLPYYGPVRQDPPLTKALIFSSWSIVPDAIAAILSYEAERRMGAGDAGKRYFDTARPRPLQFRQDQGRLAAMRAMHLIYPSPTLARLGDPLAIFAANPGTLSVGEMRDAVADRLRHSVEALRHRVGETADGRDWEWAAPAVIDAMANTKSAAWLASPYGLAALGHEEGFKEHVAELSSAAGRDLGPIGDSIIDLLVDSPWVVQRYARCARYAGSHQTWSGTMRDCSRRRIKSRGAFARSSTSTTPSHSCARTMMIATGAEF
jgi:hypothetical protein